MPALQERVEKRLLAAVESDDPRDERDGLAPGRAGGKRLRPLLGACPPPPPPAGTGRADIGDVISDDAVTGGVACELVHVGSLHHDDVIDEAATRHGVDSVNARWGNLRAILSGDFLLARASELAASLGTEVAGLLAATIGRLCEGEVRELELAYQVDRTVEATTQAPSRARPRRCSRPPAASAGSSAELPRDRDRRPDRRSASATAWRSRWSTTSSTWWPPTTTWASPRPRHGRGRLQPAGRTATGGDRELRPLLGGPLDSEAQARALGTPG